MSTSEQFQYVKLKEFKHDYLGTVRTTNIQGSVWFVGRDIVKVLGYKCASWIVSAVCEHIVPGFDDVYGVGIEYQLIPVSDMYRLIDDEDDPESSRVKALKEWMYYEVIPSSTRNQTTSEFDKNVGNIDIGYLYVVCDLVNNRSKIGKTIKPESRVTSIRSSFRIRDMKHFISNKTKYCTKLANKLRAEFSATRTRYEWFHTPFDEIVESIRKIEVPVTREEEDEYSLWLVVKASDLGYSERSGMVY